MLDLSRGAVGLLIAASAFALFVASPALAPQADAEIGRAHLDGTGVEQGFITTPAGALTLDVAVNADRVYWTWSIDSGGGAYEGWIGRANLDGTGVEPKFIAGLGYGGLAVSGEHIYWVDSDAQTIGRANLDGTGVEPSRITDIGRRAFDVEVEGDHVYWAWDNADAIPLLGWIGRASLDGTGVNRVLIGPISFGGNGALATDPGHIYWGAGIEVFRAGLDGSGAPICSTPIDPCTPAFLPTAAFDLAVNDGHIYYSGAWPSGRDLVQGIGRANLDGSAFDPFGFLTGLNAPVGLAIDAKHIYWTGGPADVRPPQTELTKRAPNKFHKSKLKFKFTSSEPDSTFECKLDKKPFKACTSPKTVKHLDQGKHKFQVRAIDPAGNVDGTPAIYKFKVTA